MPPIGRGRGRGLRRDQLDEEPEQLGGSYQQQPSTSHHSRGRGHKREIKEKTEELILIKAKHKSEDEIVFPRDPGPGTLGKKIQLITNHFPLSLPSGKVYHYDIDIYKYRRNLTSGKCRETKYRCLNTKRNREVIEHMLGECVLFEDKLAVYDGKKNVFTRRPLDFTDEEVVISLVLPAEDTADPTTTENFEVHLQPVIKRATQSCVINLDALAEYFEKRTESVPQEVVMVLETILRNSPCQKYVPIGRNFFSPPSYHHPLEGGKEIWFGYHQSVQIGQWGPTVNLNKTATTFYRGAPVLDFVADLLNCRSAELINRVLTASQVRAVSKKLKKKRIEVTHMPYRRKFHVSEMCESRADRQHCDITKNGVHYATVSEYFRGFYNRPLVYPNLPCLWAEPKNRNVYLPIEFCEIVEGQHSKEKLNEKQNAEMIKFTARPPRETFDEIRTIRQRADYESDKYLGEFGLSVGVSPLTVIGRILDPPNIEYSKGSEKVRVRPRDGQWDMRDKLYYEGGNIKKWVLVCFSEKCKRNSLEDFAKLLVNTGNRQGINVCRPACITSADIRVPPGEVLQDIMDKYHPDFIVCVCPPHRKHVYDEVKLAAETLLGIMTQCLRDKSVLNCKPALLINLCQKINTKTGGVNNALVLSEQPAIFRRPVIFIGADVNHPGPSADDNPKPSMAAVVGSIDSYPSRYSVSVRAQMDKNGKKQAIEQIVGLEDMVMELLRAFYRNTNGKKPENIIFYRDGVSEGQFGLVKREEVTAVRNACRKLQEDYEPGITFILVQKRHHTRFITQDPREAAGKMKNIPPGTAVDTGVTHPAYWNFYLNSHYGLQGTSRPQHYTVIEDDNSFTSDDLQKLTYHLCHTYARCTKSLSVPVPVAYAHLAAYRARVHLAGRRDDNSDTSSSSGETFAAFSDDVFDAIRVQDCLKTSMYFV